MNMTAPTRDTGGATLQASDDAAGQPVFAADREVSYVIEDFLGSPIYAIKAALARVRRWQRSVLPARTPEPICDLFWLGLRTAVPAVLLIAPGLFHGFSNLEQSTTAVSSLSGVSLLLLGLAGLALSYGISRERTYPRRLAIVFVAAWALWPCAGGAQRTTRPSTSSLTLPGGTGPSCTCNRQKSSI